MRFLTGELIVQFTVDSNWLKGLQKETALLKKPMQQIPLLTQEIILDWLPSTLPKLVDYSLKDIFNVNKTGLFSCHLAEKNSCIKCRQCFGGKRSKEQLIFMVACNSDGSIMLL